LGQLIRFFKKKPDRISAWIVGYLIVASRVGWRPGEILALRLIGRILSAPAEKVGNLRGLCDTVEITIGERYPEKYLAQLQRWIAETQQLADIYGCREALKDAMAERIRRACLLLGIPGLAPYALRHFAIACLKRSGWSREEIAAIVNHGSNRTAGERYGKARNGIKRPKPIFSVDPARVAAVRRNAKEFTPRDNHAPPI
jgi:integrase